MSIAILAIDPGASGGIAFLSEDGVPYSMPMPKEDKVLVEFIAGLKKMTKGRIAGYMERVGGFMSSGKSGDPNMAAAHIMFSFGRNFGFVQGVLMASGIEFELVQPKFWQSSLDLQSKATVGKKRWKAYLKDQAQLLYPTQKVTLKTADALLILTFGEMDQNKLREMRSV